MTVLRPDILGCGECGVQSWSRDLEPELPDARAQVVSPGTAYQVVSMLEGVVQRGTGVRIASVGKPLGGKTGTTNESKDTWFIGFSPDLALCLCGLRQSFAARQEGNRVKRRRPDFQGHHGSVAGRQAGYTVPCAA